MKRILSGLLLVALSIVLAAGCSNSTSDPASDPASNPASDPVNSSKVDLSALTVSAGTLSPSFVAGTAAYTVNVPNATTAITVTGTASDAKATLSANNGVSQPLNVGVNTITIRVTAQDGTTTKDYVVTVTRAGASNADLSTLVVSTGTLSPSFVAGTTAYTVNVPNATTAITVTGTASDTNATLSANNGVSQPLNVGVNTITIRVTAQDGATTKDYVVTVMRFDSDYVSPKIGTLKYVPVGTFQYDGTLANTSTVSAFRMSAYEITRAQFLAIMGTDPSDTTYSSGTTDPVQMVNWYHAIAFCNKLSIAEGLSRVYDVVGFDNDAAWTALSYAAIPTVNDAKWNAVTATGTKTGYRLPTEMEWMWAAMGATSDRTNGYTGTGINTNGYTKAFAGSNGSNVIGDYAWYTTNSVNKTHPVGTAGTTGHPNELGLYDMSGNVLEWNWDLTSGANRVRRGGSWGTGASFCTVAIRGSYYPYIRSLDVGFRVVRP